MNNLEKKIIALSLLAGLSIAILVYQTVDHFTGGCGCGTVSSEINQIFREYSSFFGIPISVYGLGLMCIFLGLTLSLLFLKTENLQKKIWEIMQAISLISLFGVGVFLSVELFQIQYICMFCTISQVVILLFTYITWFGKPIFKEGQT